LRAYRLTDGKMLWQVHTSQKERLLDGTASLALNGNQLAILNTYSITYLRADTGRIVRKDPLPPYPGRVDDAQGPKIPSITYSKPKKELLIWNEGDLHRGEWLPNQELNAPLRMQTLPLSVTSTDDSVLKSSAAFSPDGRLLALPVGEAGIYLLDVTTGKKIRSIISGMQGPIPQLVFSPNSKELAWVSKQGKAVYLANVSTGNQIATLPIDSSKVTALAFTEDGKSLLVGCEDSTALVFDLSKLPAAK
jgi:WD40 repeat protein